MALSLRWKDVRSDAPLKEVIERFILDSHDLSERTQANYRYFLGRFTRWVEDVTGRQAVLADVEPGTANAYLASRRKSGSPTSADQTWKALRSLGRYLAERQWLHQHGESVLRPLRRPRVKDERRRALTDEEMARVFEAGERGGRTAGRDRALVWTMMGTGLRAAEVCALGVGDVNIPGRQIRVRATTSKSVSPRIVTLPIEVAKELDLYMHYHRVGPGEPEAPLFLTEDGAPMTPDSLRKFFDRLKTRCGIADLCAHMLRHTWATNFHRSGSGSRNDLMEEGGWKTGAMTDRYVKPRSIEERRRAPSVFSAWKKTVSGRRPQGAGLAVIQGRRTYGKGDGHAVAMTT